jgi:E1-E2 ATPase
VFFAWLRLSSMPEPPTIQSMCPSSGCSLLLLLLLLLLSPDDQVLPGGRVPADGALLQGTSLLDESMVTGEPHPVAKRPGDQLVGGTINVGNALLMTATRVGSDTLLAQIVRLVEHAQLSKAPVQAYADRVAGVFVPAVVSAAFVTWLAWCGCCAVVLLLLLLLLCCHCHPIPPLPPPLPHTSPPCYKLNPPTHTGTSPA